jgi:O-antigen biosynthesis protein
MGNATRILPSPQANALSPRPIVGKARFLDWFSCEFPSVDVNATLSPLAASAGAAGILIRATGVSRYFRLLVWVRPGDVEENKEVTLRACVKVGTPVDATLALSYRDQARGWTYFTGQSRTIRLSSDWTWLTATFEAQGAPGNAPIAILLNVAGDVELHVAQLELTSSAATGVAGTISSEHTASGVLEPSPPTDPSGTHTVQVLSESPSHLVFLVRLLRFGEAASPRTPTLLATSEGREVSVDASIEAIDPDTFSVTAARSATPRTLFLQAAPGAELIRLGEVRYLHIELLTSDVSYAHSTLRVCASFRADGAADLSQVAFDLVAGAFVVHRGVLEKREDAYQLRVAAPCSRQTAALPLELRSNELGTSWPIAIHPAAPQPAASAPSLLAQAALVEGSFDGIAVSRSGALIANGWCRDLAQPDAAVVVDLMVEGQMLSTGFASSQRPDVAKRRGGSSVCGFNIEIPPNLACGESLTFEIRPRAEELNVKTASRLVRLAPTGTPLAQRSPELTPRFRSPRPDNAHLTYAGIILTQDGAPVLLDLLRSLERFEARTFHRLVIIDHESSDETLEIVREFERRLPIELVSRPRSSSFSESNNVAAQRCTEDILVFLNNDLVFTSSVIHDLGSHLHDDVGIVGLKLMDPKVPSSRMGLQAPQHVGIHFASSTTRELRPFESRLLTDAPPANHAAVETPAVTAALAAVRRDLFDELGGFDEAYFYGLEDVDLCLRSWAKGRSCVSVNNVSAIHVRGYSRRTMPSHILARRSNNSTEFARRWGYTLSRALVRDLLTRTGFWSGRKLNVGFVVTDVSPDASAGDYMTALDFARALAGELPCKVFFHEKSSRVDATGLDLVVVMIDDFDVRELDNVAPSTLLIAWPRNWFHRWAVRPWRERFDYWFASSEIAAQYLGSELGRQVTLLPIGTDAQRFAQGTFDAELEADVCFTGHYWGSPRDIVSALEPDGYVLKIFGKGWERVPQMKRHHAGSLPYGRMADVYKSAKIVVDDSNFATASWGSLNSRVFDALAAGALVVTNNVAGARAHFGELLPTYTDRGSLRHLLRTYLGNPEARQTLVAELQARVLSEHTYHVRAQTFARTLREGASRGLRIAIKIAAPAIERCDGWGDWYFALPLRRELEALGHHVRIDCLADWESSQANRDDVAIVLRGLNAYKPNPRQLNLMWLISHPNRVSLEELEAYDHVFVASRSFAQRLASDVRKPVQFLPQCTDGSIFFPAADGTERTGIVFVGNSRLIMRPAIRAALDSQTPVDLYGDGWRGLVDEGLVKATMVPNEQLGGVYRSAEIVLNDHWDDMRRWGFISNRIFDAVACGATVLSDEIEGLQELFGDSVRTFTDAATFRRVVDQLQATPPSRATRQAAAERLLLAHTFKARAAVIDEVVRRLDSARDDLAPGSRSDAALLGDRAEVGSGSG